MTVLIKSQYASSAYVLFSNSGQTNLVIDVAAAHNNDTTVVRRVYMNIVPNGSMPDASNLFIDIAVQPRETYPCEEITGAELEPGDSVAVKAELDSTIAIHITGRMR